MADVTGSEKRLRFLEQAFLDLKAALASLANLAGKAAQDAGQQSPATGNDRFRMQVTAQVGASSGATLGTGTARLLNVINAVRYWKTSGTAGTGYIDATVYNDTGGTIAVNTFLVCEVVNGLLTVMVADCSTTTPAACADDVTASGYTGP